MYAAYIEAGAVVIPGLRIRDILIARAQAPQPQDSDCDSDSDNDLANPPPPAPSSPATTQFPPHPTPSAKRARPEDNYLAAPSQPSSSKRAKTSNTPLPDLNDPDDSASDADDEGINIPEGLDRETLKKRKKALAKRERRRQARAAVRPLIPGGQKAVTAIQVRQTDPMSVPFRLTIHTQPVASTNWMGLRDSAIENAAAREAPADHSFKLPEQRPYNLEEIQDPELEMCFLDWDGYVPYFFLASILFSQPVLSQHPGTHC